MPATPSQTPYLGRLEPGLCVSVILLGVRVACLCDSVFGYTFMSSLLFFVSFRWVMAGSPFTRGPAYGLLLAEALSGNVQPESHLAELLAECDPRRPIATAPSTIQSKA